MTNCMTILFFRVHFPVSPGDMIIKREQADDGWWLVRGAGRLTLFTSRAQLQNIWLLFTVTVPARVLWSFEAVFYLFMCECSTFLPPDYWTDVGVTYRARPIKISCPPVARWVRFRPNIMMLWVEPVPWSSPLTQRHTKTHTLHNPLWHRLSPLPSGSAVMASRPSANMEVGQSSRMWSVVLLLEPSCTHGALTPCFRSGIMRM